MAEKVDLKRLQELSKKRHAPMPKPEAKKDPVPDPPKPSPVAQPETDIPKKEKPYEFYIHPEFKL